MPDLYAVRLPDFEGPLDVLLRLIEKRELEISKVALGLVADQFLAYAAALQAPEPRVLASFLSVAAKLLLIKSQALLPQPVVAPPPAADDEDDVAAELVARLEEYRAVQLAAGRLREREGAGRRSYLHPAPLGRPDYVPATPTTGLEGITLTQLARLVRKRMQLALPLEPAPALIPHEVTLAERVAEIAARLAAAPGAPLSLWALLGAARGRLDMVITFMAVLELLRRAAITATQAAAFDDILLVPARPDRPDGEPAGNGLSHA